MKKDRVNEIEVKVKIDNFKKIQMKLADFSSFVETDCTRDFYYSNSHNDIFKNNRLRLRIVNETCIVTMKTNNSNTLIDKKYSIYDYKCVEQSFIIKELDSFKYFINQCGFFETHQIFKKRFIYKYNGLRIELNRVKNKGVFLEIEGMGPESETFSIRKKILEVIYKLDLIKFSFKTNYYTD